MNEIERSRMIARQSQMERAIEYCTLMNIKLSVIELISLADHFAQYIEGGITKSYIEKCKRVDLFIFEKC